MKAIKRMSRVPDLKERNSKQKNFFFVDNAPKPQIFDSIFSSFQSTKQQQKHNFLSTAKEKCPYPLTIDCLEEILSHLIDDKLTLFSCILVNSLWLNLCVPLLWSNPFEYFTYQKGKLLIRTYISCLSMQDKQELLKFHSNHKENNNVSNDNNNSKNRKNKKKRFSIISIRTQPFHKYQQRNSFSLNQEPLFIYPKYLKNLNYDNLILALKEYCCWNRPLTHSLHEYKNLIFELLKNLLFNNNSILLKHLKISFNNEIESPLCDNRDDSINNDTIMTTSVNTFTRLTSLDLSHTSSSENDDMVLQQISNICLHLSIHSAHIQYLTIYMQKCWKDEFKQQICLSIFNLIKSQRNLKYLSINEFWNTNYSNSKFLNDLNDRNVDFTDITYFDQFYQTLLQHNSDTLEYLRLHELTRFDLLLNILDDFKKLKSLEIKKLVKQNKHSNLNIKSFKIINLSLSKFNCYYNYENFSYHNSIIIHSFISPIITSSNKLLESLSLSKVTKDLLLTISIHCPNITNLSLIMDPSLVQEFCALLVSLSKLHSLTIKKLCYFTDIDSSYLAATLPSSLYYFKTDIFDNSKSLNYFLENCGIDVKLSILEVYQQLVDDDTLNAVLNYKQKSGKFKEFRYSGNRIKFSTQTWELTKKIIPNLVKVDWN